MMPTLIYFRRLRRAFDRHLFTVLAIVLTLSVIIAVKQVRHIFPSPEAVFERPLELLLWAYLLTLAAPYVAAFIWVVPRFDPSAERFAPTSAPSRLKVARAIEAPIHRVESATGRRRWLTAMGLIALGALWYAGPLLFTATVSDGSVFAEPQVRLMHALFLWAVAAYLSFKDFTSEYVQQMIGRSLCCVMAGYFVGELIWRLIPHWWLLSYRNYSVWAVVHLCFLVLMFAKIIDAWQFHSKLPIRLAFLLLLAGSVAFLRADRVGSIAGQASLNEDSDAAISEWLSTLEARIASTDAKHPVVVIAASGGGSRAALSADWCSRGCDTHRFSTKSTTNSSRSIYRNKSS